MQAHTSSRLARAGRCVALTLAVILPLASGARAAALKGRVQLGGGDPAVVWLEGLSGTIPAGSETVITHRPGGRFEPTVSIGFVGGEYVLRTEDDTLHTTHLYLQLAGQKAVSGRPLRNGATVFNIAQPRAPMEMRRPITAYQRYREDTGHIAVRCNPHPKEKAFVLVFDHPYATVSDAKGAFTLPDVPDGKHDVWVWHDGQARKWRTVEFGAGLADVVIDPAP